MNGVNTATALHRIARHCVASRTGQGTVEGTKTIGYRNAMGKAWENGDLPKKNVDLNGFHGNYS